MTDQIRRSSRSVCAKLAEAWRKRRYPAHWVSKLSDSESEALMRFVVNPVTAVWVSKLSGSESEAAETQTWLKFSVACGYLKSECETDLQAEYNAAIGMLVTMSRHPEKWSV